VGLVDKVKRALMEVPLLFSESPLQVVLKELGLTREVEPLVLMGGTLLGEALVLLAQEGLAQVQAARLLVEAEVAAVSQQRLGSSTYTHQVVMAVTA
jgi:hypothetical protein